MAGGTQRGSGSGRLILASASPRRRELLRQIGLEPEIAVSLVEEKAQGKVAANLPKAMLFTP